MLLDEGVWSIQMDGSLCLDLAVLSLFYICCICRYNLLSCAYKSQMNTGVELEHMDMLQVVSAVGDSLLYYCCGHDVVTVTCGAVFFIAYAFEVLDHPSYDRRGLSGPVYKKRNVTRARFSFGPYIVCFWRETKSMGKASGRPKFSGHDH